MTNLQQRTLTGIAYVAVVIGSILLNPMTDGLSLALLMLVVAVLSMHEYIGLVNAKYSLTVSEPLSYIGIVLLSFLFLLPPTMLGLLWPFYAFFLVVSFALELFRKQEQPVLNWACFAFGQLYIALPLALMNTLAQWSAVPQIPLAIFVVIWVNDTFAYLTGLTTGNTIGNHKMFPRISPKKSWEGLAGGFLFSLLAGVLFNQFTEGGTLAFWLGLSFVIAVCGTFGDLVESLFKRTLGVKDSGTILPGHGGMLDRFDSVLFAIVGASLYIAFVSLLVTLQMQGVFGIF